MGKVSTQTTYLFPSQTNILTVTLSAILLIVDKNYEEKYGPFSTHIRQEKEKDPEANLNPLTEKTVARPVPATTAATALEPETAHNSYELQNGARPVSDNTTAQPL